MQKLSPLNTDSMPDRNTAEWRELPNRHRSAWCSNRQLHVHSTDHRVTDGGDPLKSGASWRVRTCCAFLLPARIPQAGQAFPDSGGSRRGWTVLDWIDRMRHEWHFRFNYPQDVWWNTHGKLHNPASGHGAEWYSGEDRCSRSGCSIAQHKKRVLATSQIERKSCQSDWPISC